jgi:hypothetical protein
MVSLAPEMVLELVLLTPGDIRRLVPAAFEFLWRTILSREHGASYRHVDGHGIDCLAGETAYQIYHHQGASWPVVQAKFRDDLHAVERARARALFHFSKFVFVSTFGFQDPAHRAWFEARKARALPLRVTAWGEEQLCSQLARHPDLASQFGLTDAVPVEARHVRADDVVELPPEAVTILEKLLAAPDETLTLADLRAHSDFAYSGSADDFELLLRSLQRLGFIRVVDAAGEAALLPEIRVIFQRPSPPSASVAAVARLLAAGKAYLERRNRRVRRP